MRILLITILFTGLFAACQDNQVHVTFPEADTTPVEKPVVSSSDNYEGKIPGLDAEVIDYTLPNEYQNKPQVLAEGLTVMSWNNAGFKNANDFIKFIEKFQFAVIDRNKEKIASYFRFPTYNIKTKTEFLKNFDLIFTPEFTKEVIHQDPNNLYRDKRGAMLGKDGQLWFKPFGNTYKIVNINF